MSLIYIIKTNSEHFYFHYVSKLLKSGDNEISLTITESKLLLKLCQSQIQGQVITSRAEMEGYIWGETTGIDRKTNLNQLVCTLRKKITQVTAHSVIITQPKKGYSFDDCVHIELYPLLKTTAPEEPTSLKAIILTQTCIWFRQFYLPVVCLSLIVMNGYIFTTYLKESAPLRYAVLREVEENQYALISSGIKGAALSCIEKMTSQTRFTNYFILDLKDGEMNNQWGKKICDLL